MATTSDLDRVSMVVLRYMRGPIFALIVVYAIGIIGMALMPGQDAEGNPIHGRSLADCHEVFGDEIERTVTWKGGTGVKRIAGTPVRLRFVLKDADLFAFRFRSGDLGVNVNRQTR